MSLSFVILDIIVMSAIFFGMVFFMAISLSLKIKNTKLLSVIAQAALDKQSLLDELDRLNFISSNSTDLDNGFIKFLSESRDDAFEYIEGVQGCIVELSEAVELQDSDAIKAAIDRVMRMLPDSVEKG